MKYSIVIVTLVGAAGTAIAQPANAPVDPYAQPAPSTPPPAAYPPPYAPYPAPYAPPPQQITYQPPPEPTGHIELVADFAALGLLGTIAALDAKDYDDGDTGTLLVIGGAAGGGAVGWLVADRLDVSRSEARAATLGLGVGVANGALLLVPLHTDDESHQILTTLLVGGTLGTAGGLIAGRSLDLTEGQTTFAGNLALLGIGTSAVVSALIDDDDGEASGAEMSTLAVGLDAGLVGGLAIAPHIDWSRRRARYVGVSALAGTFVGGLAGALLATDRQSDGTTETDPDLAAGGLLVGMWGGFAAGILLTSDFEPDPKLRKPTAGAPTSFAPLVGPDRPVGLTISGGF